MHRAVQPHEIRGLPPATQFLLPLNATNRSHSLFNNRVHRTIIAKLLRLPTKHNSHRTTPTPSASQSILSSTQPQAQPRPLHGTQCTNPPPLHTSLHLPPTCPSHKPHHKHHQCPTNTQPAAQPPPPPTAAAPPLYPTPTAPPSATGSPSSSP